MRNDPILPACAPHEIAGADALEPAASNISRGESASASLQSQTNPPHRILVVEDDIFLRQRNTKGLLRSGYEVDAAEDGAAAWEMLNAGRYDLMITDNNMPRVSGVELLQKLRAGRMGLPVIMATGTFPTEEFARYPWLQPDAMLLKPHTIAEMVRTVKKVLREAESAADTSWQCPTNFSHPILVLEEAIRFRVVYADNRREQMEMQPNWRSQPSADVLQHHDSAPRLRAQLTIV